MNSPCPQASKDASEGVSLRQRTSCADAGPNGTDCALTRSR
jgi:hypothetical protein